MRNSDRIPEICNRLARAWQKVPDWRLGQLFVNMQAAASCDLFYYEDEALMRLIETYIGGESV